MRDLNQNILFLLVYILLLTISLPKQLQAEGTKQLAPNAADRVFLYTNVADYGNFAQYGGTDVQRLYIHIANPNTEQIFLGFSQPANSGHYPCEGSEVPGYFRIIDPNGVVVYPVRGNPNGQALDATSVNITTRTQALLGPNQIVGTGGYDAFVFDPVGYVPGDYYIEFSKNQASPSLNDFLAIEWWDITVATKQASPSAIDGRVYAKNWSLMTPSISCGTDADFAWFDRPFNGNFHVYTNQKIVAKVDFNNGRFQAAAFNVFFNNFGTANTGDVIEDRKSLLALRTTQAQHRIFLNDPDINVYPSGTLGSYSLDPKFLACVNGSGCVRLSVTERGQVDVLIDFDNQNGQYIYDSGTADVLLAFKVEPLPGELPPYERCIPWDGRDAFGDKVGGGDMLNLLIRYTQGIYHFPIYDAEYFLTGFQPTTIRPISNAGIAVPLYYDDSNITASAGTPAPIENSFNGCDAPCHNWTNRDFGNLNTINTWFFAKEETQLDVDIEPCPLIAYNDTSTTLINVPVTIPILDNDKDFPIINTDIISTGMLLPQHGSIVFDPTTGDVQYSPDNAFIGKDSFEYVICFDIIPVDALCDVATVYVDIQPVTEDCFNGIDDDGDGLLDCDDPDCLPAAPTAIVKKNEE